MLHPSCCYCWANGVPAQQNAATYEDQQVPRREATWPTFCCISNKTCSSIFVHAHTNIAAWQKFFPLYKISERPLDRSVRLTLGSC